MGRVRGAAGRGGAVLGVVGALLVAPVAASVPASAAGTAASAIVVVGSDTANSWVVDDSNSTSAIVAEGNPGFIAVSATPPGGQGTSTVFFSTVGTGDPLPTSGQYAVSAHGPLRIEIGDRQTACDVEGTVDVLALTRDGSGRPTSVALDWTGSCAGASSGQVRVASAVPYGGLDVVRSHTWFEPYIGEPNQPYAVEVTGHGTQVPAITSVAVVPPASGRAGYVELYGSDTCSGRTLADRETCSVTVDAAPWDQANDAATEPLRLQTSTGSSTTTLTSLLGPLPSRRGLFADAMGRRMDTRTGLGVRKGVVGPGKSVTLKLTGGAVPDVGTAAAVLNLTVTGTTSAGYVTAYPAGSTRPVASSINFPKGWTGANLVTVPLGADGGVTFFNSAGTVHLVADLVGVYASGRTWSRDGSDYHPHAPTRVFDSRTAWGRQLGPNASFALPVDFGSAVNARVRGIVLNVTVAGPTGTGYVSAVGVQPTGPPGTSTLNYTRDLTAANMAVVPVSGSGTRARQVFIANVGSASTHVVVDVVGYFADVLPTEPGLRYRPLSPTRVVDTRTDLGLTVLGSGTVKRVQAPRSVAGRDTRGLVGNLTGVGPTISTYLTAWDAGPRPTASNLNLVKGVTRANSIWPGVDADNGFRLHNASGSVEAVVDVTGSFEAFPPSLDTLAGVPFPPLGTASTVSSASRGAPVVEGPRAGGRVPPAATWSR